MQSGFAEGRTERMKVQRDMWKRRLVWLVLWILSLAGISFYGGTVSYGFLAGVMLVPVISWIYLIAVFLRFKVYQEVESRNIVCGQATGYYFVLKNEDYFGFAGVSVRMFSDFSFVRDLREETEYQLLPGQDYKYETCLICRYRGEYEVGIRELVLTDFFRLFCLRYRVPEKKKAVVLPKLVRPGQLKSVANLNAALQMEAAGEKNRPDIPVREYVSGDSMKQVHWKASARVRKLMVREQTGEKKQGVSIFLSAKRYGKTSGEYLPLENKMLELTLALGIFFAERRIPVVFYYGQDGLQKSAVYTLGDFEAFYRRTDQIVFDSRQRTGETLSQAFPEIAGSRMAFFVVHEMEESFLALERNLRLGGTLAFFYLVSDIPQQEYLRLPEFAGKLFTVPVEADLEEVL